MKENELKPAKGSTKNRKRVGRGNASGWGGESGRGHKGQKSRSGYSRRAGFEGGQMPLYRRIPKRRGLGNLTTESDTAVNLSVLDHFYSDNDVVDEQSLRDKGIISRKETAKILGNGELTKKLTIKVARISKTALEKIEKSGSKVEL